MILVWAKESMARHSFDCVLFALEVAELVGVFNKPRLALRSFW